VSKDNEAEVLNQIYTSLGLFDGSMSLRIPPGSNLFDVKMNAPGVKEQIIAAIEGSNGIYTKIARTLGVSYGSVKRYINYFPETRLAFEQERERLIDLAEQRISELLEQGYDYSNPEIASLIKEQQKTAQWILRQRGKERGYTDDSSSSGITVNQTNISITEIKEQAQAINNFFNS
jgi:transposase